jgi:Bacterial archaeo-eukaryotic release factor family 10
MNSSSLCATNQKQYQRRVQNQREAFAREAVLEELVTQEGAKRVILAGDEVAIPLLHQALSPQFEPLILEEILRLDIRMPRHEVLREIAAILVQEEEESHARVDLAGWFSLRSLSRLTTFSF